MRKNRAIFCAILVYWTAQSGAAEELAAPLVGTWKEVARESFLEIEGDRILELEEERLTVKAILHWGAGALTVRNAGLKETWPFERNAEILRLTRGSEVRSYQRVESAPPELRLQPLVLGMGQRLTPERVQTIHAELEDRVRKDQEVRLDPDKAAQRAAVDAENARYLKGLVQEIGWIDRERFGLEASHYAFVLVQHSGDLSLMMAVLPRLEGDFRGTDYAQDYALLYDRLQLKLGKKQRYGTQIGEDAQGNPFVKPMEDPESVEDRWKQLGLGSFSSYLADASKILFAGKPIRLPSGAD